MPVRHRDSQRFYKALGVQPDATPEQIQLAYEALEENTPQAAPAWQRIHRAYEVLNNPESRRLYDKVEMKPLARARRPLFHFNLNDVRLLIVCGVLLVGILGFVWVPLYGSRLRSFSPGDALVTTKGEAFGTVVRSEDPHTFPGGATSSAYLIQLGNGELRWFPMNDIKASCRHAR
ncbi:MAG: J domain-containing protein [Candidatus Polarisedimenticolia bacterium]